MLLCTKQFLYIMHCHSVKLYVYYFANWNVKPTVSESFTTDWINTKQCNCIVSLESVWIVEILDPSFKLNIIICLKIKIHTDCRNKTFHWYQILITQRILILVRLFVSFCISLNTYLYVFKCWITIILTFKLLNCTHFIVLICKRRLSLKKIMAVAYFIF